MVGIIHRCVAKILADIYVALMTGVIVTKMLGSHPPRDSNTNKAYRRHLLPRSLVVYIYTTNYSRPMCR